MLGSIKANIVKHGSLPLTIDKKNLTERSGGNAMADLVRTNDFVDGLDLPKIKASKLLPKSFVSPLFMMWDITYKCPFNCLFCFNNSGTHDDKSELSEQDIYRIAREISKEKVVTVCLCGGEPFAMLDKFLSISEWLSDGGVIVNCVSNGWYITPDILKRIEGRIRTIQLSLDGPGSKTHDILRGRKGAFEQVLRAIHFIAESSFRTCELTFIPTRINYRSFPDVVKLAISLGCVSQLRTQHLIQSGRGYRFDLALTKEEETEFEELFIKVFEQYKGKISLVFGDPWAHIRDWSDRIVPPLFLQITAQGIAKISPYIPLSVGDLKQETLGNIWERVNANRHRISNFVSKFITMNNYRDGQVPWVHQDVDLLTDVL